MPREVSWLPAAALDRMQSDLQAHGEITRAALAERIIEDAAPLAAYSVVDLANNAEDEGVRLRAAQYVLDRANGKPKTSVSLNVSADNPVLKILDGVVVERGAHAEDDGEVGDRPLSKSQQRRMERTREADWSYEDPTPTIVDQDPDLPPRTSPFAPPFHDTE